MNSGSMRQLRGWIGGLALLAVGCGDSPTGVDGDASAVDLAVPDLTPSCGPTATDPSFTVSATLVDDGGTRTFAPGDTITKADCRALCGVASEGYACTAELGDGGTPVVVCQPAPHNGCS